VLSGRGLWDELITRPEESYRLWYVVVCDLETSRMRRPWPAWGRSATENKNKLAMRWRSCLRHCATSRNVVGSVPDGVFGIFLRHNPSGRPMALRSTQPLTYMISCG